MTRPKALIFDVFGTLTDWRSSIARAVAPTLTGTGIDPFAFADAWRGEYDPAMKRVRDGNRGYVALDDLHLENLAIVLDRFGLSDRVDAPARAALNQAWRALDPWPDVPGGLRALRPHALLAPCSNGSIALMSRLARHADLTWDAILGADIARDYKPKPAVYLASCAAFDLPPAQVMMVAAHNGDLHAAHALGLQTAFIPRLTEHGPDQRTDLAPDGPWTTVATDLPDLAARLFAD